MVTVAAVALVAALCLTACRTVERKPVEVETPAVERHFIVMGSGDGGSEEDRARGQAPGAGNGGMRRTN